jgi:SAM-dependent methyltransferase
MDKSEPVPSQYIHGTNPDEQRRLALLNDLMNGRSLAEITLQGSERILDVGSGLGQFTRALARKSGAGAFVLGVERSPEQLG